MKNTLSGLSMAVLWLAWAAPVAVAADTEASVSSARACVACHRPGSFAGKSEAEIAAAIQAIVDSKSAHPPISKLSGKEVADIAAFYAGAASAD